MNQEQITSILRQVLFVLAGGLVTHGYVDAATLQTIIGALIVLGTSGWAIYIRRNHGLIASAAAVPTVDTIVTNKQSTANAISATNVVGPSQAAVVKTGI
jgi:hypothetical protein